MNMDIGMDNDIGKYMDMNIETWAATMMGDKVVVCGCCDCWG